MALRKQSEKLAQRQKCFRKGQWMEKRRRVGSAEMMTRTIDDD